MDKFPTGPVTQQTATALQRQLAELRQRVPVYSLGAQSNNYRGGQFGTNVVPAPIFPAKLTAVSSGLYTWVEQRSTDADYAGWQDLPGGRTGTNTRSPAYEPNDVAIDVTDEPVVFLQRAFYSATLDWVYVMVGSGDGSGGGSTLDVTDGTTTVTGVTSLNFIRSGLIVSGSLGSAIAETSLQTASASTVNTGTGVFITTLHSFALPIGSGSSYLANLVIDGGIAGGMGVNDYVIGQIRPPSGTISKTVTAGSRPGATPTSMNTSLLFTSTGGTCDVEIVGSLASSMQFDWIAKILLVKNA